MINLENLQVSVSKNNRQCNISYVSSNIFTPQTPNVDLAMVLWTYRHPFISFWARRMGSINVGIPWKWRIAMTFLEIFKQHVLSYIETPRLC